MSEVYSIKKQEEHDSYVEVATKDVRYRTNSLGEIKRIYMYLKGNVKGFTEFERGLKEKYPCAKYNHKNSVAWYFDEKDIWNYFRSDSYFNKVINAMGIKNMGELSYRVMNYYLGINN